MCSCEEMKKHNTNLMQTASRLALKVLRFSKRRKGLYGGLTMQDIRGRKMPQEVPENFRSMNSEVVPIYFAPLKLMQKIKRENIKGQKSRASSLRGWSKVHS